MATRTPAAAVEHGHLILAADYDVADDAREKFPAWLIQSVEIPANALQNKIVVVAGTEGTRTAAQDDYEIAIGDGDDLVRDVNSFIKGLPRSVNRDATKAHYGIAHGVGRSFTHAEITNLLRGFLTANTTAPAAAKLRADLLTDIQATLDVIDGKRTAAQTGARQEDIDARDVQWSLLEDGISRAWHFLCAALPDGVFDSGLARYGFTPRQKPEPGTPEAQTSTEVPTNPV